MLNLRSTGPLFTLRFCGSPASNSWIHIRYSGVGSSILLPQQRTSFEVIRNEDRGPLTIYIPVGWMWIVTNTKSNCLFHRFCHSLFSPTDAFNTNPRHRTILYCSRFDDI